MGNVACNHLELSRVSHVVDMYSPGLALNQIVSCNFRPHLLQPRHIEALLPNQLAVPGARPLDRWARPRVGPWESIDPRETTPNTRSVLQRCGCAEDEWHFGFMVHYPRATPIQVCGSRARGADCCTTLLVSISKIASHHNERIGLVRVETRCRFATLGPISLHDHAFSPDVHPRNPCMLRVEMRDRLHVSLS